METTNTTDIVLDSYSPVVRREGLFDNLTTTEKVIGAGLIGLAGYAVFRMADDFMYGGGMHANLMNRRNMMGQYPMYGQQIPYPSYQPNYPILTYKDQQGIIRDAYTHQPIPSQAPVAPQAPIPPVTAPVHPVYPTVNAPQQ